MTDREPSARQDEPHVDTLHGRGGNRLLWRDVPGPLRAEIESRLESPVVAAASKEGGFSPGLASVLRLADGRQVFAKAVSSALNPVSPSMHRREAAISGRLPASAPVPKLLWSHDDGDWVVLVFEALAGDPPTLPWVPAERDRVLAALADLAAAMTPAPPGLDLPAIDVLDEDFSGWRCLLDRPDPRLAEVDPWAAERLADLAAWETRWQAAAQGDTLLHGDIRADNVLLTGERVYFVDWPAATVGAAWVDLVLMLPSMAMQGAGEPEELLAGHPLARTADKDAVTAVIAGLAGYFVSRSLQPPPPGIPTVRSFQRAQGLACLRWLRQRGL
ncbi:phosphotransferase [Actinopolymorpha sp. NPDC004070]|uniref:phosphotransferase family protein n=1 Tax=Actinopolymorpha sp. NPDC004070 TaxID=3154548 RepID=UPI0033B339EB